MIAAAALLALLAAPCALAEGDLAFEPGKVVVLTTDTFHDAIAEGSWILEFYAPWCGHCKALEPILDQAASMLKDDPIRIAKIDATVESGLASMYGVRGYPTLKFARDGQVKAYSSGRRLEDFLDFAKRVSGPAVRRTTAERLDAVVARDATFSTFLYVGEPSDAYTATARLYQDSTTFMSTVDDALVQQYGAGDILCFHADNVEPLRFEGADDELSAWVGANRYRLVSELGAVNFNDLVVGHMAAIAVVDPSKASETKPFLAQFEAAASNLKHTKATFSWLNGVQWSRFASQYNVTPEDLPTMFVLDHPDIYYRDPAVKAERSMVVFVEDVLAGKVQGQGEGTTAFGSAKRTVNNIMSGFGVFVEEYPYVSIVLFTAPLLFFIVWIASDTPTAEQLEAAKKAQKDGGDDDDDDDKSKKD